MRSKLRNLKQLTKVAAPAWVEIEGLLAAATVGHTVIPADLALRTQAILDLQVTAGSFLGGIPWNCGAILIDHNWIRVLGAGVGSLPAAHLAVFRDEASNRDFEGVLVAVDVLGGRFVIHGNGLDLPQGEVVYFAVDTLDWTPMGVGHGDLVRYFLTRDMSDLYAGLRWENWERDTDPLLPDDALAAYPPPWSEEGAIARPVKRWSVPISEVLEFQRSAAEQFSYSELARAGDGQPGETMTDKSTKRSGQPNPVWRGNSLPQIVVTAVSGLVVLIGGVYLFTKGPVFASLLIAFGLAAITAAAIGYRKLRKSRH